MHNINSTKEEPKITVSAQALQDSRFMIEALAAGKLNYELQKNLDNPLKDSLTLLQSNLRSLTWVMDGITKDKKSLQNELRGDFKRSFDAMLLRVNEREQSLEQNAKTDTLTGIPNRLAFMQSLDFYWKQGKKFFITFIDIDNLKYRNDHYGHAEGDRFLRYACNFISLHCTPEEKLYRLGGDEFVLLTFHGTLAELDDRIEAIRTKFSTNQHYNSDIIDSFSYGSVSMDPNGNKTASELLGEADQKMYIYKANAKASNREAYHVEESNADVETSLDGNMLFETLSHCTVNQYIFTTDQKTGLTRWSLNAVRDLALPGEYVEDMLTFWSSRLHPDDFEAYMKDITEVFTGKKLYHDITYRMKDASGTYIKVICRGCMLYDNTNTPVMFAGVLTNLGIADNIDTITGLPNLYDFIENIDVLHQNAKGATVYGITFDNFSSLNNNYGRSAGDSILKQFADKASALLKGKANTYRLKGVDFAFVFDKITKAQLTAIHKQLQQIAKKELCIKDIFLDMSMRGAALKFAKIDHEATTILAELQNTLDKAKLNSVSSLLYLQNNQTSANTRSIDILDKVKRSAENDCRGFYMVYQPQVNYSGKVIGAEALLRWHHNLYGEVKAEEYIYRLENSDCFNELCMWALRTALIDFKSLLELNPELILSVNIAYNQLTSKNFCKDIMRIVQQTEFPAANLMLEFDNNCYTMNNTLLCQKIATLHKYGIKIAVDKFNANDLNLSILRDLELDEIKIDTSFIHDEEKRTNNQLLFECLQKCAKAFGINVCAKYIETKQADEYLHTLGIDIFQGFYYCKPIALTKLQQYINNNK